MVKANSEDAGLVRRRLSTSTVQKFSKTYRGKQLRDAIEAHAFFTTRLPDRDGAVRLKHNDENKGSTRGVGDFEYRVATETLLNYPTFKCNPNIENYQIARQGEDGRWIAYPVEHERIDCKTLEGEPTVKLRVNLLAEKAWAPEDGKRYIYVRMPNGDIRISLPGPGANSHFQLSGNAPYVVSAGEVFFEGRMPTRCNPMSGTYTPPDSALHNAGLVCSLVGADGEEYAPTPVPSWAASEGDKAHIVHEVVGEPTHLDSPPMDQEAR